MAREMVSANERRHYNCNVFSQWLRPFPTHVPGQPPETPTAESGGIWIPHSPVPMKISVDKKPLNRLTVNFFSLIIKTFCYQHQCVIHEKAVNLSVWMKEICTLLVKLHIICSRMQRVNLHFRPSIMRVGCPTYCYQVCALYHAKGDTGDLDYPSEPCHRNELRHQRK